MVSADRIDGVSASVAVKAPVRCATTENITLTGLQTIDGIVLVEDDRVLVKNQTDATENGIYSASALGWTRALDFDGYRDMVEGTLVYVVHGTTNEDRYYRVDTTNPILIGESNIVFTLSHMSAEFADAAAAAAEAAATAAEAAQAAAEAAAALAGEADGVAYDNAESGLAAVNVQEALDELALTASVVNDTGYVTNQYYATGGDTMAGGTTSSFSSANTLVGVPWVCTKQTTFNRLGFWVGDTTNANGVRLGIYKIENGIPTTLVVDAGTIDASTTGAKEATIDVTLDPGLYLLCFVHESGSLGYKATGTLGLHLPNKLWGTTSGTTPTTHYTASFTYGALPSTFPAGTVNTARGHVQWLRKV